MHRWQDIVVDKVSRIDNLQGEFIYDPEAAIGRPSMSSTLPKAKKYRAKAARELRGPTFSSSTKSTWLPWWVQTSKS